LPARRQLAGLRALRESGLLRGMRPDHLVRMAVLARHWGPTTAAGCAIAALRFPERLALVDDRGALTWEELHRRTNALGRALAGRGVGPETTLALMCRNGRGFVEPTLAASKLGADAVFVNTGFGAEQLAGVLEREGATAAFYDEEFAPLFDEAGFDGLRVAASIETSVDGGAGRDLNPPPRTGRTTILTSG